MKIIFLILVSFSVLLAKQKATCLSIQLASEYRFQNYDLVQNYYYPKGCKYMVLGRTLAVRCGCYGEEKVAQRQLEKYKTNYPDAELLRIYKSSYQKAKFIVYSKGKKKRKTFVKLKPKIVKPVVKKVVKPVKKIDVAKEMEQELRLMLQVFLYKGDLVNAYKVASYGVKKYNKVYYWNKKMAEVCRWSGRFAESMKYLRRVYEMRYDKKIENELIKYGMKTYQYEKVESLVLRKAMNNPTEKNIDLLIKLYKNIGLPEKVIQILEKKYKKTPTNNMLLTKMLALSLEMGDLDLARRYVAILEQKKPYTQKDAALISKYYYIKHDIFRAYKSLVDVDNLNITNKKDNIHYYELLSDLAWYLQKNLIAAKASKKLIDLKAARLEDYERAMFGFRVVNPKLATKIAKAAYNKYKLSYLFYTYANAALNNNRYQELRTFISEIEQKDKKTTLYKESMYWIIKSKIYKHFNQLPLAAKALKKALRLSPNDFRIKLMLISYYIEVNNAKKVKDILLELENHNAIVPNMYLSVASAYFYLNDINHATFYMQKLKSMHSTSVNLIGYKFLQAYIYQAQDNNNAFIKTMKEIAKELKVKAKRNPKLKKQDQFLSNYLRATIHIWPAEKFRKKLKKAKKYLSKKNYDDIRYSFAIRHKAYEKSRKIYRKTQNKALWLHFSNSLIENDHSDIEDILREDLNALAILDASKAAYDDGQISLAQTMAFKGLTQNDYGDNAYIQHLNYLKERSHSLRVHLSNNHIDPLVQNSLSVINENYIGNNLYLFEGFGVYGNELIKPSYIFIPKESHYSSIGFRRLCSQGYSTFEIEYFNAMKNYLGMKVSLHHNLASKNKTLDLTLGKNQPTRDGILLMLGGKQDYAKLSFAWKFLQSTTITTEYINATFESQDNVYLGYGHFFNLFLNRQIRNGYPDMRAGLSYQYAYYHENLAPNGIIDTMQSESYTVLAQTSSTVGASFSYGMANSSSYTRVWRPYFEVSTSYNDVTQDPSYNFNIGYGGKLFNQDHIAIGASHAESVAGISSYELYVNYLFYY